MKILHIIRNVNPEAGGALENVLQQSKAFEVLGWQGEILSLDSPDEPWVIANPVKTHAVGIRSPLYKRLINVVPWLRYGYTPHLVPWLRAHVCEYDLVIVNGLWNYCAFGALRGLRKETTPYVVYTHGMLDPWFRKTYPVKYFIKQIFWWLSEGRLMSGASAAIFTTEEERLLARNEFWPWRVRDERVVPYGIADVGGDRQAHVAAFRTAFPDLEKRRFLLFLSRIHPKKGVDILIQAFGSLARAYPDVDIVIGGPDEIGLRKNLEELAESQGVARRVHWLGMLRGGVKWGAYLAADAFVLPSHSENYGIVVAEALACGMPVLITDKVNIWREIEASGAGLVSLDELAEFTRILRKFLEMSDREREQMGLHARAAFLRYFDIKVVSEKLVELLRELTIRNSQFGTT